MVAVPSASYRIHSWLLVYLRLSGVFIASPVRPGSRAGQYFSVAHERRFHHPRAQPLVTNQNFGLRGGGSARRHARERDRLPERRRETAAGDQPFAATIPNRLLSPHHAPLQKHEPDALPCCSTRLECPPAFELACGRPIDGPCQPALEGRHRFVHVLTIEVHPGLEPQRIARTESGRRRTRASQCIPHAFGT